MAQAKLINVRGNRVMPNLPPWLAFSHGDIWHVKPYSGSDSNPRDRPDRAVKTLVRAQAMATADQNDIVLLYSESNTGAYTTDYLTTTLEWAKDGVHLIGVNSGGPVSSRSRVSWLSTAASSSDIPLITFSADNCYISDIGVFVGIADANLSFGLNVTGDRNRFERIGVVWPGDDTNDAAGGYALKLDGVADSLFKDCWFGSYTISTGTAANSIVLMDTGLSGVKFENCDFIHRTTNATNSVHLKTADAGSIGFGCVTFVNSRFIGIPEVATAATAVGTITAGQQGRIIMDTCFTNLSKWDNSDSDMILVLGPATPAADTCCVALAV